MLISVHVTGDASNLALIESQLIHPSDHSGYILNHEILHSKISTFCLHSVFTRFVRVSGQTAITRFGISFLPEIILIHLSSQ